MSNRIVYHLNFFKKLAIIPIYIILRLWYATLRLKMDSATRTIMIPSQKKPCVFYFWHHNLFVAPMLRKLRIGRFMYGLMSASKDGAWLEALVKWFDVQGIRGSSSWRGGLALQELDQRQHSICDIIITPDGPKGPCCQCKSGSLKWAWIKHFDAIALHFQMPHAWRLKSWDRFCIPWPFSRVTITAHYFETSTLSLDCFQSEVQKQL